MGIKESVVAYIEGIINSEILALLLVNVIIIIIWLFIGLIAVKVTKRLTFKVLKFKNNNKRTITLAKLVSNIIGYFIWFIVILVILNEMSVNIAPLIASAGVLGLAIGFGAQEIVKDFISGFFIILDNTFNVGEVIEAQGFTGEVLEMGLRTTKIQNYKGDIKTINNGDLKNVTNFSRNNSTALIYFGVAYDTDLMKLNELMIDFVKLMDEKYDKIVQTPKFLGVTELADSSINLLILAKTENFAHFQIERDLRRDLVIFLTENNIEIPFPHVVMKNG